MRRFIGALLVVLGSAAILTVAAALLWSGMLQRQYRLSLPRVADATAGTRLAEPPPSPGRGSPIGVLEIPRLGLSSVVVEGDDTTALLVGVGHLPDTPLPWARGNSVLAAHRDTFFRPLANIRRNDLIRFTTADAAFEYVVEDLRVVGPTAVEVLAPTPSDTLTLVTCYPFHFIGPAPDRFIVRAERRDGGASSDHAAIYARPF